MRPTPVLTAPPKPNFMVVDGRSYFLEEVNKTPEELLKTVEEYYEANLSALRAQVTNHCSEETQADLDAQLNRIERYLRNGVVAISETLRDTGTVLMFANNKIHETRIVLFKPQRVTCTLRRVMDYIEWVATLPKKDQARFTKFVTWGTDMSRHFTELNRDSSAIKTDIFIEQDLILQATVCAHIPSEKVIRVTPINFHPHVYSDGHLCTGGMKAEDFWSDPQFVQNFNMINPHSFANSGTPAADRYKEFFKNQYFVEGRVREQEVTGWRT